MDSPTDYRTSFRYSLRALMVLILLTAVGSTAYVMLRRYRRSASVDRVVDAARTSSVWPRHDGEIQRAVAKVCNLGVQSEAARALIPLLADDHSAVRSAASFTLIQLGKDTIPALIAALHDNELGSEAACILARYTSDVLPEIRIILEESRKPELRARAAYVLLQSSEFGSATDGEIAILADVITGDSSPRIRRLAAQALKTMGLRATAAMLALCTALGDDDKSVRIWAARAIAHIDATKWPQVAVALVPLLADDDAEIRGFAAGQIGWFGSHARSAQRSLLTIVQDTDYSVRRSVVCSLGSIKADSNQALVALVTRLADGSPSVRSAAAWAIGEIAPHSEAAVIALSTALGDDDPQVREDAATALGRIGRPARSCVALLIKLQSDINENVRFAAEEALKTIDSATPESAE